MKKICIVLIYSAAMLASCSSSKNASSMTNIPQATNNEPTLPSKELEPGKSYDNSLKNKKIDNNSEIQTQKKPSIAKEYKAPSAIADSI